MRNSTAGKPDSPHSTDGLTETADMNQQTTSKDVPTADKFSEGKIQGAPRVCESWLSLDRVMEEGLSKEVIFK